MKNPYTTLGLPDNSPLYKVREAYRILSLKYSLFGPRWDTSAKIKSKAVERAYNAINDGLGKRDKGIHKKQKIK